MLCELDVHKKTWRICSQATTMQAGEGIPLMVTMCVARPLHSVSLNLIYTFIPHHAVPVPHSEDSCGVR